MQKQGAAGTVETAETRGTMETVGTARTMEEMVMEEVMEGWRDGGMEGWAREGRRHV